MVLESLPVIQGSQLFVMAYMALELSQIKRAMKESDVIEYQSPALIDEFLPVVYK